MCGGVVAHRKQGHKKVRAMQAEEEKREKKEEIEVG